MANDILTQDYLKSIFEYRDGKLYWKISGRKIRIGRLAGSLGSMKRYRRVCINGKIYQEHRIIFMMHYGYLPECIDHIDNNKINNKIDNLRAATISQNKQNIKRQSNNVTGYKNVSFNKKSQTYTVEVVILGKRHRIGTFKDLELAGLVANMAREKYHGNFANHG